MEYLQNRHDRMRIFRAPRCPAFVHIEQCFIGSLCLLRAPTQDIMVNTDFGDVLRKVKEQIPLLKVRTGGDGVPLRPKAKVHPMIKLKNFIEKNNMRVVDFFNSLDEDHSMGVTREEFAQGIEVTTIQEVISLCYAPWKLIDLFCNFRMSRCLELYLRIYNLYDVNLTKCIVYLSFYSGF